MYEDRTSKVFDFPTDMVEFNQFLKEHHINFVFSVGERTIVVIYHDWPKSVTFGTLPCDSATKE